MADKPFQIIAPDGTVVGQVPDLPPDTLKALYRWMWLGRLFTDKMMAMQRQGRMGTFGGVTGQEATQVALAWVLQKQDWLITSYREVLAFFVKGVPLVSIMRSYRGHVSDGYPRECNVLPFQIVLSKQMLHACGVAMAARIQGDPVVALGICGDGAASEGDFHEALNFAGVFKAPAVFVVQNNGWAISVPRHRQTAAENFAIKGLGYGIPGVMVDGNDPLACYVMLHQAVQRARAGEGPTLVEAITYRLGPHTTADDPRRYVPETELREWKQRDPLIRYRKFLMDRGLLEEAEDARLQEEIMAEINGAVDQMEAMPPTRPDEIFDYVYSEKTPQLQAQQAAVREEHPACRK